MTDTFRWPRGMREPVAAEYVGLSVSGLRGEVRSGRLKTVRLTPGRCVYLREDLDGYLDKAAGRPAPDAEEAEFDWKALFKKTG